MAGWNIVRTKPLRKTYGRALPAFIHNGDYHLTTLDVYADGAVSCWGFVDLPLFERKVASGWVATRPPVGATVSVFNLGGARVAEARWTTSRRDVVRQVREVVRELNPEGRGLIDMEGDDTEIRNGVRYAKLGLANEKPYRKRGRGAVVLGAEVPVFLKAEDGYRLERWFVYADGQSQLGYGADLLPVEEAACLFGHGQLATAVPDGAWVTIDGLGRFRAAEGYWHVKARERVREGYDLLDKLGGQPGSIRRCIELHAEYEREPSAEWRAALRRAYEAVPEHLRRYCGDMDSKDGPIRWILYGGGKGRKEAR